MSCYLFERMIMRECANLNLVLFNRPKLFDQLKVNGQSQTGLCWNHWALSINWASISNALAGFLHSNTHIHYPTMTKAKTNTNTWQQQASISKTLSRGFPHPPTSSGHQLLDFPAHSGGWVLPLPTGWLSTMHWQRCHARAFPFPPARTIADGPT